MSGSGDNWPVPTEDGRWRWNWSGHTPLRRARVHEPATVAEVQRLVARAERVRVVGAGHSFNALADTDGDLLWLGRLAPTAIEIAPDRRSVSISAGLTYDQLGPALQAQGLALANTASLRHITVAGAVATATHGSGDRLGNLATAVAGLELVTADGERVELRRGADDDRFPGAVVSLGALGVMTRLTLDVEPTYDVVQHVYAGLPWDALYGHFDEITSAGYSVSLFPTWQQPVVESVWVKHRLGAGDPAPEPPADLFGARLQERHLPTLQSDRVRTAINEPGPWHHRLPHFALSAPGAVGNELQSEYFVARHHAVDAIRAVAAIGPALAAVIGVTELRTVAADDLWLSPAFGGDVVAIHFNWWKDWAGVSAVLPAVEAALAPFEPIPHWGKLHALTPAQVMAGYPRLGDFRQLAAELDPAGVFANDAVRTWLLDA
ncbi:MAG: FAD-binding protein [Acidimicrobiia bacterium]|nr:FAD-binding protein [Acidimicrobiia bacterium]